MIKTYQNFEELAEAMVEGGSELHARNCPYVPYSNQQDPCIDWQRGVSDFAEWLDHVGAKVKVSDGAEDFYEFTAKQYKK